MLQVKKDAFIGMARGIKREECRRDKPNSKYYQERLDRQDYDLLEFYQGGLCQEVPMLCFQYHGFAKCFGQVTDVVMPGCNWNMTESVHTPHYVLKFGEERYRAHVDKLEFAKRHLNFRHT